MGRKLLLLATIQRAPAAKGAGRQLVATIRKLNVKAEIIPTTFSRVDLGKVLNTKAFSMEEAASQPGWLQELRGEHKPETEEYGISSFVYRSRRPFNGLKLRDLDCDAVLSRLSPILILI